MKKTIEMIKNELESMNFTCKVITKEEREKSFITFKSDTLKALSKGFILTTKESNNITSAYAIKNAFVNGLKVDKMELLKDEKDESIRKVYAKVLSFASSQASKELKESDTCIYSSYEMIKNNDFKSFNEFTIQLLGIQATKELFNFIRAYMFTTEKELSKKAYVNKFIALIIALKEYQGNYSIKYESVTFKHIIKDIKVSTFDKTNYTYEDLKAVVSLTEYKKELVNNNMQVDTKVLNKALKEVLLLNEEEEELYYELFK